MEINLLESLILTAETDCIIPVDVFMSGIRTDGKSVGCNDFTFWNESNSPDNDENLALENICPDRN